MSKIKDLELKGNTLQLEGTLMIWSDGPLGLAPQQPQDAGAEPILTSTVALVAQVHSKGRKV